VRQPGSSFGSALYSIMAKIGAVRPKAKSHATRQVKQALPRRRELIIFFALVTKKRHRV
jgi:hypothetical protein